MTRSSTPSFSTGFTSLIPLARWKYMRSVVFDGNFSAQHRHMRHPEDDVPLADGHAFMVTDEPYKRHLGTAKEFKEVRDSVTEFRADGR